MQCRYFRYLTLHNVCNQIILQLYILSSEVQFNDPIEKAKKPTSVVSYFFTLTSSFKSHSGFSISSKLRKTRNLKVCGGASLSPLASLPKH